MKHHVAVSFFCWVQVQSFWNLTKIHSKTSGISSRIQWAPSEEAKVDWMCRCYHELPCVMSCVEFSSLHAVEVLYKTFQVSRQACWQRLCGQRRKLGMGTGILVPSAFAMNFRWTFAVLHQLANFCILWKVISAVQPAIVALKALASINQEESDEFQWNHMFKSWWDVKIYSTTHCPGFSKSKHEAWRSLRMWQR